MIVTTENTWPLNISQQAGNVHISTKKSKEQFRLALAMRMQSVFIVCQFSAHMPYHSDQEEVDVLYNCMQMS